MPLSKQDTALLTAAESGKISKIEAAIKSGAELTARDEYGYTALLLAALKGHNDTIDHLVETYGCRLDERTKNGDTALLLAAWNGQNSTIGHLVEKHGRSLVEKNKDGATALLLAALGGHNGTIDYLKECGCGLDEKNNGGATALLLAAWNGHNDTIDHLVKTHGCSLDKRTNNGDTALLLAARNGHHRTIDHLVKKHGRHLEERNNDGATALLLAAWKGHLNTVKHLCQLGIDVGLTNKQGDDALVVARRYGKEAVVKFLTDVQRKKAKEEAKQKARHEAEQRAEAERKAKAETKRQQLEAEARQAEIARRQAAEEQQRRAEAEQQQRSLQFQQYCRESGLAQLAKENNLDGIHYLLTLPNIDINATDAGKRTALHYLAIAGNLQGIKTLVERGADIFLKDGLKKTPYDNAIKYEHAEVAVYLEVAEQAAKQRAQPIPRPMQQPNPPQQPIGSTYVWEPGGGNPAGGGPAEPSPVDIDPELYIDPNELTLIKKLKVGGFGIVYQGMWGNKAVAIKQLKEQAAGPADAENERDRRRAREEFVKELCMMKNLRHPCIVTLYGISYKDNRDSMVMEFLPKGALTDLLKDPKKEPQTLPPFPWSQRLKIAIEIGEGLAYLHRRDVVHHDLHPGNVLLDEQGRAKLVDFGLSKIKRENEFSVSSVGQPRGHNRWRAPETFEDQNPYTKASDIFSYGLILWSIATRKEPHENLDAIAAAVQTMHGVFEPFPDRCCPRDYKIIADACRQMEPKVRPTANEVVERLGSIRRGPIQLDYVGFFAHGGIAAAGGGAPAEHTASPTTPAAH